MTLIIPYIYSLRWRYGAGAAFLLVTNAIALLIPWFMKLAVDALQGVGAAVLSPHECAVAILLLALLHCVTRIFSRTCIMNAARVIEYRIRNDLFLRLMRLDAGYYQINRSGDIISRFSNDLTNVRMLVGFGIMSAINTLLVYLAAVSMMVSIAPWLTFLAVLPLPLMVFAVKKISRHIFHRTIEAQEELANLSNQAQEAVSSVRLIKSYCRETYFDNKFRESAAKYLRHNLRIARLRGVVIPVMAVATGAGTLIVLFVGGKLVIGETITLGDFVAFSGYLSMLVWPTAVMGWILTLAQKGAASMSRLAEILTAEPLMVDSPDAANIAGIYEGIELKALHFAYSGKDVLKGISLYIGVGECIGITGEVGCGKSTLLQLFPRLLSIPSGMLFIDGIDINDIKGESLRRMIGYVPQETFLFSRSIAENLNYGGRISTIESESALEEAASAVGFMDDIRQFQEGMSTRVGERGVTLSGGQKQRLAIARALLGNPPLLLLDDPLSALDAGHEEEIIDELRRVSAGRTTLIVSHRLSAFRHCNRIIVMQGGLIAEQGTAEELAALKGIYFELCRQQGVSLGNWKAG